MFWKYKCFSGRNEHSVHSSSRGKVQKIEKIFKYLTPWLKTQAVLCHGDFHKGNVLLSKVQNLRPFLIDFDSMSLGHPFFDVAKFSLALPSNQRQELFREYLGGRMPTPEEESHFELIDLSLLMLVACVRFNLVDSPVLSKIEMEEILDSQSPLPSFLKVPFGDSSAKTRQLGAVYALAEFLKRTAFL